MINFHNLITRNGIASMMLFLTAKDGRERYMVHSEKILGIYFMTWPNKRNMRGEKTRPFACGSCTHGHQNSSGVCNFQHGKTCQRQQCHFNCRECNREQEEIVWRQRFEPGLAKVSHRVF
jgi:hypothetical protein